MAQRTEVILIDDVDGGKASQTIDFALDGVTYEIDLSDKNAAKLRHDLNAWADKARRTGGKKKRSGAVASTSASSAPERAAHLKEVRAWARSQGLQVSDRGRLPAEIETAYQNAHA